MAFLLSELQALRAGSRSSLGLIPCNVLLGARVPVVALWQAYLPSLYTRQRRGKTEKTPSKLQEIIRFNPLIYTLTLQTCDEEKRARIRQMRPRTVRLRRIEAYLTVREILPEMSKGTDGVDCCEFSGFGREQVYNIRVKYDGNKNKPPPTNVAKGQGGLQARGKC